jgi:hypothetical protein
MPRWIKEVADQRRDLLGLSATQTQVMDSSKYTLVDGASELAELEERLQRAAHNLQQFNKNHLIIHTRGKLPPGAILATDWDEEAKQLVYIGYRLEEGGQLIRFLRPIPCRP